MDSRTLKEMNIYCAYVVFSAALALAAATSLYRRAHLSRKVSLESKANALPSYENQYTLFQQCSTSCDEISWSERVLSNKATVQSQDVRVCAEKSKLY